MNRLINITRLVVWLGVAVSVQAQSPPSDLVFSYILGPGGNQLALQNHDTLVFPSTVLKDSVAATLIVWNRGAGPGSVNAVSVTGDSFKVSGLPLLPAALGTDQQMRFSVVFSPTVRGKDVGTLRINTGDTVATIALEGSGAAPSLTYESLIDSVTTVVAPNGTVHVQSAPLGTTRTFSMTIRNGGNADGRIASVSVLGTGFKVADLPPLPAVIAPGGAFSFNVVFAPVQSGTASARLLMDDVAIGLESSGVGSQLTYAYRVGSLVTPITDTSAVTFPNTTLGAKSSVVIQIGNTGNAPGSINGISLSGSAFSIELPPLPATINPNSTLEFGISFSPDNSGNTNGVLQIDDRAITLRGIGNTPPPLPSVSITKLAESAEPLQQPTVGLALSDPYPLDLTGKLILTFASDSFVDDPAIQFATGGRTVDFHIPANTTEAVFGENARQVQFQAGTVAGVISVSASFAAGGANLTPATPPSKTVLVSAGAPVIRDVRIGTRGANSVELLITGLSTARSISQLNLSFTPAAGATLQTQSLTVNAEGSFDGWYQSAASRPFGSQFTASVGMNVAGDASAVQSITVTMSNARGASNPVTVNLR